jgi:arylsulfatase A-like enzyme
MDRGMATLLQDLADSNLLDSTIVWWGGEFGRTPKIAWESPWNGGRHHFGDCFSAVLAGGGFKGGMVVGASDRTGEHVAERPVYPADLLGSILELMGIDPDGPMPNGRGLELKIMPVDEKAPGGVGRLREIM